MKALTRWVVVFIFVLFSGICQAAYLSPEYLAVSPDGKTLYVTAATSDELLLYDIVSGRTIGGWTLPCHPSGITVASDGTVYVTGGNADGDLYKLDATGKILARIKTGHTPLAPVVAGDGETVCVLNRFDNSVVAVDLATRKVRAAVQVLREPFAAALGSGGRRLFVANHLPGSPANGDMVAAAVSVIDMESFRLLKHVMLPNGSTDVRGITADPDGRFIYVTHMLGRFQFPTMQLERGWMNTAGLSIFNGISGEYINTVLLDDPDLGAANSWGVAVSPDGKHLIVAHAGTREISIIDRKALHLKLDKAAKGEKITDVANSAADVPNDLSFLANIRHRIKLGGDGPRGVAVTGDQVFTALYFSDALAEVRLDDGTLKSRAIPLGPAVDLSRDPVRYGEMLWNDATLCFQQWLSCASCHPDGRADGLNWDLLNDGTGNPKNTRSMLLSFHGNPSMALGVRANAGAAVRAGIKHIEFSVQQEEKTTAIDAYIQSLQPVPSPHLIKGRLTPAARRGKKVFFDQQIGCAKCHAKPLYLDKLLHDVGSAGPLDRPTDKFTTSTLMEVWRTAPYLHDGRYLTIEELMVEGKHGLPDNLFKSLSKQQIDDLIEFILSL